MHFIYGSPPLSFSPSRPLPSALPFLPPPVSHSPLIQLEGLGRALQAPQRVRAQPGHQSLTKRIFGAFRGAIKHFMGRISCMFLTDGTWRFCCKVVLPRKQPHWSIMLMKIAQELLEGSNTLMDHCRSTMGGLDSCVLWHLRRYADRPFSVNRLVASVNRFWN